MSSNQINCVEKYAWVDEALEDAWNQAHFEEDDEELNQETFGPAEASFGPAEASFAYIPIPMEIDDDISVSTISLGEEDVDDYEYDDFSVADAAEEEEEDEGEHYEYAAAAGDAYGYAAPVQGNEDDAYDDDDAMDDDALNVVWDVPIWYRQTTRCVLTDGTVVYNGHADGQRIHNAAEVFPLIVVHEPDDAMDVV